MSGLRETVSDFLAKREEYVRVLRQCVEAGPDYHRWSGHAEARRQLADKLTAAGIDLTAEPLPVVNREKLDKVLVDYLAEADDADVLTDALYDASLFRDEATVKAEALREAATAARGEAASSRTNNGRCEAESLADWLDDRATEIDPARLEGAHP